MLLWSGARAGCAPWALMVTPTPPLCGIASCDLHPPAFIPALFGKHSFSFLHRQEGFYIPMFSIAERNSTFQHASRPPVAQSLVLVQDRTAHSGLMPYFSAQPCHTFIFLTTSQWHVILHVMMPSLTCLVTLHVMRPSQTWQVGF